MMYVARASISSSVSSPYFPVIKLPGLNCSGSLIQAFRLSSSCFKKPATRLRSPNVVKLGPGAPLRPYQKLRDSLNSC